MLECPTLGWHKPGFVNLYPISLWASTNLWVRTGPSFPTVQLSHLGPKWCDQPYGHTRFSFRPAKHNPRCFARNGFGQKKKRCETGRNEVSHRLLFGVSGMRDARDASPDSNSIMALKNPN